MALTHGFDIWHRKRTVFDCTSLRELSNVFNYSRGSLPVSVSICSVIYTFEIHTYVYTVMLQLVADIM